MSENALKALQKARADMFTRRQSNAAEHGLCVLLCEAPVSETDVRHDDIENGRICAVCQKSIEDLVAARLNTATVDDIIGSES